MEKLTEKERFLKFLKLKGYQGTNDKDSVYFDMDIIPHYRITDKGNHNLISKIVCCIFGGKDTPIGGLGCVTFYYRGAQRYKYRKTIDQCEILKKALVCHSADEAIEAMKKWIEETSKTIETWKVVL